MRVPPPEGLEQRISAAVWREREVARDSTRVEPRRRSFRFFSPALAGLVTSACAIALMVLWQERRSEDAARHEDIRYLVTTVEALPARIATVDLRTPETLTVSSPLGREIDSVRADARSALGFLAANFLPSSVSGSKERPATSSETQNS